MSGFELFIGNKNYSSWSLRPWIAMKVAGIPFEEHVVPFDFPSGNDAFRAFSPTGKVPVLRHGEIDVWESLAILEYLAERHPDKALWPEEPAARALARAVSSEMHADFGALRRACPMNMRRAPKPLQVDDGVTADVHRIETIWRQALERSGGPFLFGAFTAADAMFAPVVNRLEIYCLTENAAALSYMNGVKALPAWREWEAAGRAEPWVVEEDEV